MTDLPVGPPVDATPRPLPARINLAGRFVRLEPLHPRHVPDLWDAARGADASWTYMVYGPFADRAALAAQVADMAAQHDPMMWAVRPLVSGRVQGWLALMHIEPRHAAIELGHVWFGPALQRTRAGTEAMALLLRYAADDLGYRRLVWKCDSHNAASRRAAERLGFTLDGVLRQDRVVRGRQRDTAMYSIIPAEWPRCAAALRAWLDDGNYAPDGTAVQGLAALRAAIANQDRPEPG